jgi:prepilin-type N-terminal cleavage/methylation domain-containing protein
VTIDRRSRTDRGFTLIEVLVTLVITSLLFGVLIAALVYGFRTQDALSSEVARQQATIRAQSAFFTLVGGALPADRGSARGFVGKEQAMAFEALAAAAPGSLTVPLRVSAGIVSTPERVLRLEVQAGPIKTVAASWPADEAAFSYVDDTGAEHKTWPPVQAEGGLIPRQVRLTVRKNGAAVLVWVAAPQADPRIEPKPANPFGVELGR